MSAIPELLAANERFASRFEGRDASALPRRGLAVLTCMDARLEPARFLGLAPGDAHVIRNAGGRVSANALRSLIVSCKTMGVGEIVVIHHTECGMMGLDGAELQAELRREPGAEAMEIDFLTFSDLDESVRHDVRTIRETPLISPEVRVWGFVYDVRSGRLREVE